MKKVLIIFSGIYLVFLGLVCAGVGILPMMMSLRVSSRSVPDILFVAIFYIVMSAVFLTTGVGLFMRKNWARFSIIIQASFALFMGLMLLGMLWVAPWQEFNRQESANIPWAQMQMIVGIVVGFFLILIPVFFLIFFNLRSTAALFSKGKLNSDTAADKSSSAPLGIKIIAVYYAFAVFGILSIFMQPTSMEMPVFGDWLWLSGTPLKIYTLASSGFALYLAYGFFKLKKAAWFSAVAYNGMFFILSLLSLATLSQNMIDRVQKAYAFAGDIPYTMPLSTYRIIILVSSTFILFTLIYVFRKRAVFVN